MSWAYCGKDQLGRDMGYGIRATCDEPDCQKVIDRGLAHVCGDMHGGGKHGCGRYFCSCHLFLGKPEQLCSQCHEACEDGPEDEDERVDIRRAGE